MLRRTPLLLIALAWLVLPTRARADDSPTEVVVRANPVDRRSTRDETAHSTVLRREDLDHPGATTAAVVGRAPGAQVQRSGSSAETATLSLRGSTSAQLPVYLGPFSLNDELTGTADLSLLPLFFIERIEIYRGHAPGFADRLGLSGAVVLEPRVPRRTEGFVGATVGSYGASSLRAGAAVGNERASNLIAVDRSTAANDYPYLDNRGTVLEPTDDRRVLRQNADFSTVELWNTGHYRVTRTLRLRWLLHGFDRQQGITGLSVVPARHVRATTRRELGAITATMPCRPARPEDDCRLELQSQWQNQTFGLDDPYLELGYGTSRVDSKSARIGERLRIAHPVSSSWSVGWLLGVDVGTLKLSRSGSDGLQAIRHSALLGANSKWLLNRDWSVIALGRLSAESTAANGPTGTWQRHPSGRVGLRYRLFEALTLSSNLGSYGRTPTLAELYGTSPNLRGNAELRAERGVSEDLGINWQWSTAKLRGSAEAVAYHQRCQDLVAWQRTSFGQVRPYNVGQSRLIGAELSAGVAFMQWLRLEAMLGLLDARDVTPSRSYKNDILPYRSRLSGNVRLEASLPSNRLFHGLNSAGIAVALWHRSSRYAAPAGNAVLASATSVDVDARLGLSVLPVTLRASIVNLLDRQNYDILGMPLPGRCAFAGADVSVELE